jgi:hypothetical protein
MQREREEVDGRDQVYSLDRSVWRGGARMHGGLPMQ